MNLVFLCLTAVAAGAVNAIAGGGTLLTFPALLSILGTGATANVLANGTSTTALVPGALAGAWGFRSEVARLPRWTMLLVAPSLIGGVLGSVLAVCFPSAFKLLVPWLILTAAVLFALQPQISRWTGVGGPHSSPSDAQRNLPLAIGLQFFVAVYGGYFGAGIGILMLSVLGFMGLDDIQEMNALKNLLASLINGISAIVFVVSGCVDWHLAPEMAVASIIGGYMGARVSRRLNRAVVRSVVVGIGFTLASYYFYGQFKGAAPDPAPPKPAVDSNS
jgi:uncharacterized membrane protein YfcA